MNNLMVVDGNAMMSSLDIAKLTRKRHDNVKRTIGELISKRVITSPQIEEKPTAGRSSRYYVFTGDTGKRDSIVVVAQLSPEFTGALVDRWQELEQRAQGTELSWDEHRQNGKIARRKETDAIKLFVEYAKSQGSKNAEYYYANLTKATYNALYILENREYRGLRNHLSVIQLMHLVTAEAVIKKAIEDSIEHRVPYKEIYKVAVQRVNDMASLLGKSLPCNMPELVSANYALADTSIRDVT